MEGTRERYERLLVAARRHDGVLHRSELTSLGATPQQIRWRTREGGPWQLVLPDVVATHTGELTQRQRHRAALLQAGPGGLITGAAALALHRVRRAPRADRVEVRVPHTRRRTDAGFLVLRRSTRRVSPTLRQGVPVTSLADAVIDFGLTWPRADDTLAVVCEVVQRRRVSGAALRTRLDRCPRAGSASLRRAVAAIEAGVWSVAEEQFRQLCRSTRTFPEPRFNRLLGDLAGVPLGRPDAWLPEAGLAIAMQSLEHHLLLPDWERTLDATTKLSAAGLAVVQLRPTAIRDTPAQVLDTVRRAYRAGLRRGPVPGVQELPDPPPHR